jgi:hypothetical protein
MAHIQPLRFGLDELLERRQAFLAGGVPLNAPQFFSRVSFYRLEVDLHAQSLAYFPGNPNSARTAQASHPFPEQERCHNAAHRPQSSESTVNIDDEAHCGIKSQSLFLL